MDIIAHGIEFSPPAGLQDITPHRLRDPSEQLEITIVPPEQSRESAAEALADQQGKLVGYLSASGSPPSTTQGEVTLAGRAARFVRYALDDGKDRAVVHSVAADVEGERHVGLVVQAKSPSAELDARINRWVGSAALPAAGPDVPLPSGQRRYYAGSVSVDLPQRMCPPRTYRYADFGIDLTVGLTIHDHDSGVDDEHALLERRLTRDTGKDKQIVERHDPAIPTSIPVSRGVMARCRLRTLFDPIRESWSVRAVLRLSVTEAPQRPRLVEVFGRASTESVQSLDGYFDGLLHSIREAPES